MQTVFFEGSLEAKRMETSLRNEKRVEGKQLLIIQADGAESESTYVRLKREMGQRLGAMIKVVRVADKDRVLEEIDRGREDERVDGILIQLPIRGASRREVEQILSTIPVEKDVDGLNPKSSFVPAVVMAVEAVLEKINLVRESKIALVGAEGMVGRRLYDRLLEIGYVVSGFEEGDDLEELKDFDVVVVCTGMAGIIKESMVKEGFVGIDLGYPKPEISEEAAKKAGFLTPVPGGVGPMTMVSLYENLAEV